MHYYTLLFIKKSIIIILFNVDFIGILLLLVSVGLISFYFILIDNKFKIIIIKFIFILISIFTVLFLFYLIK